MLGTQHPKHWKVTTIRATAVTLITQPFLFQDWVAIDGFPMCDPCLDDEQDVDRMALAQTDSLDKINMVVEWVEDPTLPFDAVNPINHHSLYFTASKNIPANSRLCWFYPMVHQV